MTDKPPSRDLFPQASTIAAETPWYKLFSRGARDWLRHNQKVRETVKGSLPDLLSGADTLSRSSDRTVLVPVRLLEHARFRLRDAETCVGAGQGKGEPGEVLRPARSQREEGQGGGSERGEFKFVLELKIDDILDWLWDELKLPDLKPKHSANVEDPEYRREGWDKRGARSRLDRRRTVKEAVKRRAVQEAGAPAFTDDDLRYRQLVRRRTPALNAVVMFVLDVSGSMVEVQRKLAKTFFFFALHGIRRKYAKVEMVFVAHASEAWEFQEGEFFQVTGDGGTQASSAFRLCEEILNTRYNPSRYNAYLFYASDGENASTDHEAAAEALSKLIEDLNYAGYIETMAGGGIPRTEMNALFSELARRGLPAAAMPVSSQEDVWSAIRHFFSEQAGATE